MIISDFLRSFSDCGLKIHCAYATTLPINQVFEKKTNLKMFPHNHFAKSMLVEWKSKLTHLTHLTYQQFEQHVYKSLKTESV